MQKVIQQRARESFSLPLSKNQLSHTTTARIVNFICVVVAPVEGRSWPGVLYLSVLSLHFRLQVRRIGFPQGRPHCLSTVFQTNAACVCYYPLRGRCLKSHNPASAFLYPCYSFIYSQSFHPIRRDEIIWLITGLVLWRLRSFDCRVTSRSLLSRSCHLLVLLLPGRLACGSC